jgi:hypothetical protein
LICVFSASVIKQHKSPSYSTNFTANILGGFADFIPILPPNKHPTDRVAGGVFIAFVRGLFMIWFYTTSYL